MTIEELKQALEAATPGPWEIFETGTWPETNHFYGIGATKPGNGCYAVAAIEGWTKGEHPNARLIVAAVNNLPALLKVVEAADYLHRVRTSLREVASDQEGRLPYCYEGGWSDLSKALEELNNGK